MGLNLVACDDSIKEAANKTGDPLTGDGGDTYEDVAKFGEPDNKAESQAGDIKMIIASWSKNINGDLGANVNVTFTKKDGKNLLRAKHKWE
ncbi:hypothetical protein BWGOE4_09010 [Bacillus mycoides]|nr:hypothetical protein BWGOE4_09010 [Bacillus mycoides]OFD68920.1 hypothetical protein BWGOE7_08720 [Bacillus mycoides]OFD99432.1 hypothetical protein BWGOE12_08950 [Bacillus mycoides]